MCGIIGHISKDKTQEHYRTWLLTGLASIRHRGPDHEGIFESDNVLLGHRRLSIIDLSSMGNQPVKDKEGNVLIFNGEIYNFKELGIHFLKTKSILSDTVVLFELLKQFSVPEILPHLDGMFAFSFYEKAAEKIHFATDTLGIKGAYYQHSKDSFAFCSEISPLINHPDCSRKINHQAFRSHLSSHTSYGTATLVDQIKKFKPGVHYQLDLSNLHLSEEVYDNLTIEKESNLSLKEHIIQAVEKRLVSDAPLALLLSGGIDSNIINAIIHKELNQKTDTFSLIFENKKDNESKYIQQIQKHFNHNHYNISCTEKDIESNIFDYLFNIDYPSSDGLNTYLISKAIHEQGIKVALSGLGADELFSGYPSFKWNQLIQRHQWISHVPHSIRKTIGSFKFHLSDDLKNYKLQETIKIKPWSFEQYYPLTRLLRTPQKCDDIEFLLNLNKEFIETPVVLEELPKKWKQNSKWSYMELQNYTNPILLRDADQMSMRHQIELRVPFLDRALVSKVLFNNYNSINPEQNKWELVQLFANLFPKDFFSRKKTGFDLPLDVYLQGPLLEIKKDVFRSFDLEFLKESPINEWHLLVLMYWIKRHGLQF